MNETPIRTAVTKSDDKPGTIDGSAAPAAMPHDPTSIGRRTPMRSARRPAGMTPLPEFEAIGQHAIAAPVRRPRHDRLLLGITRSDLRKSFIESRTIGDGHALRGRPCAKARHSRPQRKVRVGFGARHALGYALDAHLAFELDPEEHQCG